MTKYLTMGAALALFLAVGLWNILGTGLAPSEPGDAVQQKLAQVPLTFGNWEGVDRPMHEIHVKVSHAEAYLNRTYTEKRSGRAVNILVLYGNPGDLGAHDPKVCYGSTGHDLVGSYTHKTLASGVPNNFWAARFEKPNSKPFDVMWAWGTGNDWQAPDSPRFAFAGQSRIFKVYIQQPADGQEAMDATLTSEFLNALKSAIHPTMKDSTNDTPGTP